ILRRIDSTSPEMKSTFCPVFSSQCGGNGRCFNPSVSYEQFVRTWREMYSRRGVVANPPGDMMSIFFDFSCIGGGFVAPLMASFARDHLPFRNDSRKKAEVVRIASII